MRKEKLLPILKKIIKEHHNPDSANGIIAAIAKNYTDPPLEDGFYPASVFGPYGINDEFIVRVIEGNFYILSTPVNPVPEMEQVCDWIGENIKFKDSE